MGFYMDLFSLYAFKCSSRTSTETLHQQVSSHQSVRFSRIPPGPLAALDRAVRKACRLMMDQLLLDLQPYLQGLLSRSWLVQGDVIPKVCGVLEHHCELYSRVRSPCREVGVYAILQKWCLCHPTKCQHNVQCFVLIWWYLWLSGKNHQMLLCLNSGEQPKLCSLLF